MAEPSDELLVGTAILAGFVGAMMWAFGLGLSLVDLKTAPAILFGGGCVFMFLAIGIVWSAWRRLQKGRKMKVKGNLASASEDVTPRWRCQKCGAPAYAAGEAGYKALTDGEARCVVCGGDILDMTDPEQVEKLSDPALRARIEDTRRRVNEMFDSLRKETEKDSTPKPN